MAIVSRPQTREFDEGYNQVKWDEVEAEATPVVRVKYEFVQEEGAYFWVARCPDLPDLKILSHDPVQAFELAESFLQKGTE